MSSARGANSGGEEEGTARTVAALVERLGQVERSLITRRAFALGLSATQAQLLLHLADRAAGVMTLADALALAPGTVSEAVSALVRKGLLARRPDPADGRRHVLVLTRAGRRLAAGLRGHDAPLVAALAAAGADGRAASVLMEAVAQLVRAGVVAETGMCLTCRHLARRGAGYHCALIDRPLTITTLRLSCPDHRAAG